MLTTVLPSELLVSDRTERTIEVNLVVPEERVIGGSDVAGGTSATGSQTVREGILAAA
ncbi:MAG: hypothetical protein L0387_11450 [Acidobacteria bacterium]|nr:hypothetical protein [Acidobacteriota bacterium]